MSGQILPDVVFRFEDSSGNPISGGTATFYLTGTTTLTTIYADASLQTALPNPISTNSAGLFINGSNQATAIYMDPSITYRGVFKNAVGTVIRDIDPVSSVVSGGNVLFLQSGTGAIARSIQDKARDTISALDFIPVSLHAGIMAGTNTTDVTTYLQAALNECDGRTLFCPGIGPYIVSATLSNNVAPVLGAWAPGIKIKGEGMVKTKFDNRVANAPMIDIDSAAHGGTYEASIGSLLEDFAILTTTSPANSIGVRVLNGYEVIINHVYIKGMSLHGIELRNGLYLDDGWNMVSITNTWIDSCAGWGLKADGSAGRNEGSFTYLCSVFFQSNGTASASTPPPSGGMIYKGQVLIMNNCAFANGTQNCGLFVKGESGLANNIDLQGVTFENCVKRSIYCTGASIFKGRNLQMYNNDTYISTTGCEFDGSTYVVRKVDIDGITVRAGASNNPYTAFKISGVSATVDDCRVRNVSWENFDHTGQTRFDGWQFDAVAQNCGIVTDGSASYLLFRPNQVAGTGNKSPLRLRGGGSTSGEWVATTIPNVGLSILSSGLLADTMYSIYLYDDGGNNAIEISTTTPVVDASSGYMVKTGDATRLYVGRAHTAGAGAWVISNMGYINPTQISGNQGGATSYTWFNSSDSKIYVKATLPSNATDGVSVLLS